MDAALAAERAVEEAVREAERAGALAVQEATDRAAEIAHRCDERVRRVHDRCAAALARQVAELSREDNVTERLVAASQRTPSESLLDRVAAWLTSPA
jgi:hypothetical protein